MIEIKRGPDPDTTEIYGQVFADQFFKEFCKDLPLNQLFKIVSRDNGIVILMNAEPNQAGGGV